MSALGLLAAAQPSAATAQLGAAGDVSLWSGPAIAFWAIAAIIIGGAISTVTRRNAIAAVMSLVATFFGLAAMYAMLSAHFLAALQVLVYAGAIMVLFIFVVMVLNRDELEPWAWTGLVTKMLGVFALVYLMTRTMAYLTQATAPRPDPPAADFGTVADVGHLLFTDYLFAFEAVSILLLIAVVAAVVVARSRSTPPAPGGPEPPIGSPTLTGHGHDDAAGDHA